MRWQIDSLTASLRAHQRYWATQLPCSVRSNASPTFRWFLYECAFLFMAISIRLFLDFFLKFSTGFCLLVSSLHEAGSLLLFFFAPSRFLLPFLKGFTCHKNSFQLWVPR